MTNKTTLILICISLLVLAGLIYLGSVINNLDNSRILKIGGSEKESPQVNSALINMDRSLSDWKQSDFYYENYDIDILGGSSISYSRGGEMQNRITMIVNNSVKDKVVQVVVGYPKNREWRGIEGGNKIIEIKSDPVKDYTLVNSKLALTETEKAVSINDKIKMDLTQREDYVYKTFNITLDSTSKDRINAEWVDLNYAVTQIKAYTTTKIGEDDKLYMWILGSFAGGAGNATDPYLISNWTDLNDTRNYLSSSFLLITDLNSSSPGYADIASTSANGGAGWIPIGDAATPFTGVLNGGNHTISDLYSNQALAQIGLFGRLSGGTVRRLGLLNESLYTTTTAYTYAGGITGSANSASVITECFVQGNISLPPAKTDGVGGLAGLLYAGQTVNNSYAFVNISGGTRIGGAIGYSDAGTIKYIYAVGKLYNTTDSGGILGYKGSSVIDSYYDNDISHMNDNTHGYPTTTANMKLNATFINWSIAKIEDFDNSTTWFINDTNDYPRLGWEYSTGGGGGGGGDNPPTITLNLPSVNYFSTLKDLTFNYSITDDFQVDNASLYINGTLNRTDSGTGNNTNLQFNLSFDDGMYSWFVRAWDNESQNTTSSTRYFTVDTIQPAITINRPYALEGENVLNGNQILNWSVVDVHLSSLWFDYNGTNVSIFGADNQTSFQLDGLNRNLTFWANDTAGNINSQTVFWNYSVFINNATYNSSTYETQNENFILNVYYDSSFSAISANLSYNGSSYTTTKTGSGNNVLFSKTLGITAPYGNKSFYWNISLTNATGTYYFNSSTYYQMVNQVSTLLINATCGGLNQTVYFNLADEENFTALVGDFEYRFIYSIGDIENLTSYGSLTTLNNFSVCVNLTQSLVWNVLEGEIFYRADAYVNRRYYIFSGTNLTVDVRNITLYDLLDADQTSFKLEVEDTSLNPYQNKYTALLRWYPQFDEYRIVEMEQTDTNGESVVHVVAEDVDYRMAVYERNGSLISMESPTRFVCLINPCTYTLRISPTDRDFTSIFDVDYSFDYNATTSIWSFVYSDSSQRTSGMNLTVYKVTGTSTYAICEDYSSDYAGVLTCNTSLYSGTLKGVISRSASPAIPFIQKIINTASTAFQSTFGLWLSFIIGIPIVFVFALISPIAAVIGGVIALIPAFYFGAINLEIIGGFAVLAGIVMHFLKRIG